MITHLYRATGATPQDAHDVAMAVRESLARKGIKTFFFEDGALLGGQPPTPAEPAEGEDAPPAPTLAEVIEGVVNQAAALPEARIFVVFDEEAWGHFVAAAPDDTPIVNLSME